MTLPYPRNAFPIVQARANGMRPAGPLIVVMTGEHPGWDDAVVFVDPGKAYRWDWVKALPNVVVLIGKDTRLGSILQDIEAAKPAQLDVIDTDRMLGWLVNFTSPKLKTSRWSKAEVIDWLGDCTWHNKLQKLKEAFK